MKRNIKIWWRAIFRDYAYWRVKYNDGNTTRLLTREEAQGLAGFFKGRVYIDYTVDVKR